MLKYNFQAPRYTSYPTAPTWETITTEDYIEHLQKCEGPLSLYCHIPFCKSMCLFCGCSVILNRNEEKETIYVDYLMKEIDIILSYLGNKRVVSQLHFGGGTPTKLSSSLLRTLVEKLQRSFVFTSDAEIAIEVDPRTVFEDQGEKLRLLRQLGFTRVSFGVQDTNIEVQKAVKRFQSLEMTCMTCNLAKELGFKGINIDLIYGLPLQTLKSFKTTIDEILALKPDRIALFSYAKIPWLKLHQRAIDEKSLPSLQEKFSIYEMARKSLIEQGYIAIGMDHFALPDDELALSYSAKTLQRNFQGYTVKKAENFIGLGLSSIGFLPHLYIQNEKELAAYYEALNRNSLPILRGKVLSHDDIIRKWTIHTLMCQFELTKRDFCEKFHLDFDTYFASALDHLDPELVINTKEKIEATPLGELLIRNVVVNFDAYFQKNGERFSYSI